MEKRKVLIVDDEPGVRESLRMVLKEQYDAVLATSGEEALEMLAQVQPDLVLLDVLMPGIDGLVVLERIKEQDQRVPVLMRPRPSRRRSPRSSVHSTTRPSRSTSRSLIIVSGRRAAARDAELESSLGGGRRYSPTTSSATPHACKGLPRSAWSRR
jgi:CheY-like chemotaxis protein